MTFRRLIEIEEDASLHSDETHLEPTPHNNGPPARNKSANLFSTTEFPMHTLTNYNTQEVEEQTAPNRKGRREYARDADAELELELQLENIRRVRIRTVSRGVTERFEVMFGYFEEGGKPEAAFCCGFRTMDVGLSLQKIRAQKTHIQH